MKKFLCLKDLVMKTDGRIELTAGKLYRETKPVGHRKNAVVNNSGKTHNNVHRFGIFVETFERDGVEWIKNHGAPVVPPGWIIDVMTGNGCVDESETCDSGWSWKTHHADGKNDYCIYAIRIISTGEPLPIISTYAEAIRSALEEAVSDGLLSPLPDIAESTHRVPVSVTGVDPSPVPAQPIDTTPQPKHTIPAQAVADIDYHPLRLGAAHFLKGAE